MTSDPEIWKSAQEMMDRYGDDALIEINARIQELHRHGALEAQSLWVQIGQAAKVLLEQSKSKPKQ